ncbi:MAG: hypothetical protein CMI53_02945 [Parcubacteria group bacterium]|jgi:hypothetical protein|nr:hypothetical protein [Parcubacteria group bacterium]
MLGKTKKNKKEDADSVENEDLSQEDTSRHLDLVKDILENTQANIKKALNLLKEKDVDTQALLKSLKKTKEVSEGFVSPDNGNERIIEGVFNGELMVGGDGVEYNVPANYASKSKLVEGDILKLTITRDGSFIYKQIGPVERMQLVASLTQDDSTDDWYAVEGKDRWKLLTASVTYFHGSLGDEVVILLPKDSETKWAAVENVIKGKN